MTTLRLALLLGATCVFGTGVGVQGIKGSQNDDADKLCAAAHRLVRLDPRFDDLFAVNATIETLVCLQNRFCFVGDIDFSNQNVTGDR